MSDTTAPCVALESLVASRKILYGEPADLPVMVHNQTADVVLVREITAALSIEQGAPAIDMCRMTFRWRGGLEIPAGGRRPIRIELAPPLDSFPNSNVVTLSGTYIRLCGRNHSPSQMRATKDWFNVCPVPAPHDATAFISFKDPEDEPLAMLAKKYFERAGLNAYVATKDERVGSKLWKTKIPPAIRRSSGLLAIWTPRTAAKPENIVREISLANGYGVPVGMFLGDDAAPPVEYPGEVFEHLRFPRNAPRAVFADGIAAAVSRWRDSGRLF